MVVLVVPIKDTRNKGHIFNEDTVCSPNHIELCTNLLCVYMCVCVPSFMPLVFVKSLCYREAGEIGSAVQSCLRLSGNSVSSSTVT